MTSIAAETSLFTSHIALGGKVAESSPLESGSGLAGFKKQKSEWHCLKRKQFPGINIAI